MKEVLYDYDIYPKVFLGDREQTVTVQPLGAHASVDPGTLCDIQIRKVSCDNYMAYPERACHADLAATVCEDGCLRFSAFFSGEGEYFIYINDRRTPERKIQISVYSLLPDMAGRYPYRGDLHLHTCRSDGKEAPATVAANYRGHGYDFMAMTDHHRYYPSLEAMNAWDGLTDLTLVPGEEVQLPLIDAHYINFGGSYSINALISPNHNQEKGGDDLNYRSLDGKAPDVMSLNEFEAMIQEKAKDIPLENETERRSFAILQWIYSHIRAGGGLGVFPHPYWLCPVMQMPEEYTEFVYRQGPFDAFEVLGGERYYAQNGFQTGFYYEMKAKGIDRAVVGSTDSHGSTEYNPGALICSTVVFAKENTREALVEAIRDKYSLAVDTNNCDYRLVGDFRLMKYGSFLMENYFPLHDFACRAEGYYMNRYLAGDERALEVLRAMKGQIPAMLKKYFAL